MTTEEYLIARKSPNWRFKKIVNENSFMNVNRVHPLKQKVVRNIVAEAKKRECSEEKHHFWKFHSLRL